MHFPPCWTQIYTNSCLIPEGFVISVNCLQVFVVEAVGFVIDGIFSKAGVTCKL